MSGLVWASWLSWKSCMPSLSEESSLPSSREHACSDMSITELGVNFESEAVHAAVPGTPSDALCLYSEVSQVHHSGDHIQHGS